MRQLFFLSAMILIPVLAGCMSFEYSGQSMPVRKGGVVNYFESRAKMPADRYRIIGRGILTAPGNYDVDEIRERLVEEAEERGADGVCVTELKRVAVGFYPAASEASAAPSSSGTNPAATSVEGSHIAVNSFGGQVEPLANEAKRRYEIRVRALFLLNRKSFDREMKGR